MSKLKVAIIGSGICGFSCALELERNGIVPVVFDRDRVPGWIWPSITIWPNVFYNSYGDIRTVLIKQYNIEFFPVNKVTKITMKSANEKVTIEGKLAYAMARGNQEVSLENQLSRQVTQTATHFSSKEDYKNLKNEYDYVVVATGKDSEAREMGVWEDEGVVYIVEGHAIGSFNPAEAEIFFNTDYAGTGYGRVTPLSVSSAVIGLYLIGKNEMDALQCFRDFIRKEGLDNYEYVVRSLPAPFTTDRIKKFKVDNVLLAGRAAGLTERVLGCGAFEALASGTIAARAIATGEDYDTLVKPLQEHVENISAFRKIIDKYNNDDFDRLLSKLNIPGVKQIIYDTNISFTDMVGKILKGTQNNKDR